MKSTKAAIYARADNDQDLKTQIALLKQTIRNNGCTIGKTGIYSDIGKPAEGLHAILRDVGIGNFKVLYLTYNNMPEIDRQLVKQAVQTIYAHGLSAIVVSS